ncbi:MAG: dihydrolipoyl dehydrogenase [Gemmatimonadetes bacterium]|nr:dihydrolipoyl dehydrogenase [Gemmatimonadota bacterium]MBT8405762.1 dihydrolipoyl dehydrogenase [Gemmatimonadota bacterium]NNF39709.1 dihydrolipoyl dehydrogenase [Gemmatimonadota bacterium]
MAATDDTRFDIIVVGSGPGGYIAAIRASQLGMNVACVEADKLGGVCLNIGCIPTKAMLTSALLVNDVKTSGEAHGITASDLSFDLGPAQERSRRVANQLSRGIAGLFKKNKITHVQGYGRLQGGGAVAVENEGETRVIHGESIIVATGSRPRNLPSLQIDEDRIWSSTGALMQTEAPGSLLIVGAGAIGMEFADVYEAYGTKVTIVEALDRILPLEDREVSAFMARTYKKRGMDIHTGAYFESADIQDDGVQVSFKDSKGEIHEMKVDYVLSAVGRVPNSEDVGLAAAGVDTDDRGFIQVDAQMRTNVAGVYALGDVAGRQLLAHKAMHEGVSCVEHIAGVGHHTVDYDNVPNCTYCHPEVASVGLTEDQAREAGHDIEVGKFPWVGIGRAVASGHAEGFIKVIRDTRYSEILGAHIVGPHATELIAEFVLGRHLESTVEEMERAIHPHPTLSEGVGEGALAALGRAMHI